MLQNLKKTLNYSQNQKEKNNVKITNLYNAVKKLIKGSNTSPTISSVKPSIHKTKKAQKTSEMKIIKFARENLKVNFNNIEDLYEQSKGKDIQKSQIYSPL